MSRNTGREQEHGPGAGTRAVSRNTGREQERGPAVGRPALLDQWTWAEERELPRAEPKERAWSTAAAGTSESSAAPAGLSQPRPTFL